MPPVRASTLRVSLRQVLRSGPGERLEIEPSECLDCDTSFAKRERYTRPGRCPRCHSRRISLPRFFIKARDRDR